MTRQGTSHTARARAAQSGRAPAATRGRVVAPAFRWDGPPPGMVIGIDTGVCTGLAVIYEGGGFDAVDSCPLHEAMEMVRVLIGPAPGYAPHDQLVVFEDARLRTWFGRAGREQLQGAGSIKRDCGIWADYLRSLGVRFHGVSPEAKGPKLTAAQFKSRFGWAGKTNEHARDAAVCAAYGARLAGMRVDYLTAREGQ